MPVAHPSGRIVVHLVHLLNILSATTEVRRSKFGEFSGRSYRTQPLGNGSGVQCSASNAHPKRNVTTDEINGFVRCRPRRPS
jgi:hypothetical protein